MPLTSAAVRAMAKIASESKSQLTAAADVAAAAEQITRARPEARALRIPNLEQIIDAEWPDQWVEAARRTNGEPYTLAGFELWKAEPVDTPDGPSGPGPLRSKRDLLTIQTCRQVGKSENLLNRLVFEVAKRTGCKADWYFHSNDAAYDFAAKRLRPMLDECPFLFKANAKGDKSKTRKSFFIRNEAGRLSERFLSIHGAGFTTAAKAGQKGRGATPDVIALDEFQLIDPAAARAIVSSKGFRRVLRIRTGTPLVPDNQLTVALLAGTEYVSVYFCCWCGHSFHPDLTVDEAARKPISSCVGVNPHWDGETTHESPLPCAACKFPRERCPENFKCRRLIMVCPECGGSLEHLRGRAGICDDGIGEHKGAVLWWPQNPDALKQGHSGGDSWRFTPFDVSLYSLDAKYAMIEETIREGGVRLAINEECGLEYAGGEGCMVRAHWTDAAKVRTLSLAEAARMPYECVFCTVDWGDEAGYGTWVHLWGVLATNNGYKLVWIGAESFSGEHDDQRRRAADWAKAKGAQLAFVDAGYDTGGSRYFIAFLGEHRVIRVAHPGQQSTGKSTVAWLVAPPDHIAETHVFAIPKDQAFSHLVACLSQMETLPNGREANARLVIPWKHPEDLEPFLRQWGNVYHGKGKRHERSVDGLEVIGDKKAGFRKAGPMHSLDCAKFAFLFLYSPAHTQMFLGLARAGGQSGARLIDNG